MLRHLLALAAMCLAVPAVAGSIGGCGTQAIPKASFNSIPKLTSEIACFAPVGDAADTAVAVRRARIAALTPATTPVQSPPVVITTPPADTTAPTVTKLQIGMNLAPTVSDSTEQPFIDRGKLMQWTQDWQPYTGPRDATGFPSAVPAGVSQLTSSTNLDPGPAKWVLTYDGSPAVIVYASDADKAGHNVIGWNALSISSMTPGRIEFSSTGGSVQWSIQQFDKANPLRNVHLFRADQEAAFKAGAVANPDFLAKIGKRFSPLRTMDWNGTNGSQLASWAGRPVPSASNYGMVPLEVQIAVANEAGADLWLNIPHLADDDYIRRAATLVRDTLAPGLKVHLEYSNEVWNNAFQQSTWAQAQADKLWGNGSPVYMGMEVWYGFRSAQMAAIAKDVFKAAPSRLIVVVAPFPGWGNSDMDDAVEAGVAKAGKGPISALFDEYAVTTYFGDGLGVHPGNEADRPTVLQWAKMGAAGLDLAFQEIEHGGLLHDNLSLDWRLSTVPRQIAKTKQWGLLYFTAYEGGLSATWFASDQQDVLTDFFNRLEADPRMGQLYTKMATRFQALGATSLAVFTSAGRTGIFGPWGTIANLASTSPRYEALTALSGR